VVVSKMPIQKSGCTLFVYHFRSFVLSVAQRCTCMCICMIHVRTFL